MEEQEKKIDNSMRRVARLAAVQGLYQMALSSETPADLIRRFRENPTVLLQEERTIIAVDVELFAKIVAGVTERAADLDSMIAGALDARLSANRLELLLKSILRAGAYELLACDTTPESVILNDYIDVAHGFFEAKEPGLVNAVLDRLAKKVRS